VSVIQKLGAYTLDLLGGYGFTTLTFLRAAAHGRSLPSRMGEVFRQMYTDGIKNLHVVGIVGMFTGMVLTLQAGLEMSRFAQQSKVGIVVAASMCREMGPFMTGLILAACAGSAMAAEIGTMKVSEEIDALEVMSIDPVRFLVMPRLFSMVVICPLLTIFTNIIGILGGSLVAHTQLSVSYFSYFDFALRILQPKDIYTGLFKAAVFGVIIASVSCSQGLMAKDGALGVGRATRLSVISSFLLILITGYFMTSLFYR